VSDEELETYKMERNLVTGIAYDKNEARVTLTGLPDKPGTVAEIFAPLAEANINVDMIVQSVPRAGEPSTLTFTVPTASLVHSVEALKERKRDRLRGDPDRHRCRESQRGRRRDALQCGHCRPDVPHTCRSRHQHHRHHDE
jgi:aspartokinase